MFFSPFCWRNKLYSGSADCTIIVSVPEIHFSEGSYCSWHGHCASNADLCLFSYRFGISRPCRKWTPSGHMTTQCALWCPHTTCYSAALSKPLRSVVSVEEMMCVSADANPIKQLILRFILPHLLVCTLAVYGFSKVMLRMRMVLQQRREKHRLKLLRHEWSRIRSTWLWEPVWRAHTELVSPWWCVGGMREWRLKSKMISSLWDFPVYQFKWLDLFLSLVLSFSVGVGYFGHGAEAKEGANWLESLGSSSGCFSESSVQRILSNHKG